MNVIERRVLRGPNIYSAQPVYWAVLDLATLATVPSNAIPGFVDALLEQLPTLHAHHCSPGHVGGFVERLRDGTYMAHVVEHVALELQCLVGHTVGFGRTRQVRGTAGWYRVVFAYRDEAVAQAAFDAAVALADALATAGSAGAGVAPAPADARLARPATAALVDTHLPQLRRLADKATLGPSTKAIVDAAERRNIPAQRLTDQASMFQLGWGVKLKRIQATMTSQTDHIAVGIASDKQLTKRLLAAARLPVPQGSTVASLPAALAAARATPRPVAIKPLNGNQGKGVTTAVSGDEAVSAAFARAQQFGRHVIVEEHITGDDFRVLVVGSTMVAASRRVPPEVTGDGQSSIRQLVDTANADPRRGAGHLNVLSKMRLDEAADKELAAQGLTAESTPDAGRVVRLRGNANLSTGGTAQDVTDQVHPDTAAACVRAARTIGLDVAGIDLVCRDIALPLAAQGGALIEVNAAPGIRMHEHPSSGARRHVGAAIVGSLFASGDDGRIPVVAVAGTNGDTTTARAIAHVLQTTGRTTGLATADGIWLGGHCIERGDGTGDGSARAVLTARDVEVAVLATASTGVLTHGLAFDHCDVAVVLDMQAAHVGQDGIDTVEQHARAMGVVVGTARKAVVLNADDAQCVALAARAPRRAEIVCFGADPSQPAMARHLARGGRAVYLRKGVVVWADGPHHAALLSVKRLPGALGVQAQHTIAGCLAAAAALLAMGVPGERVADGLATFGADAAST